MLGPEPLRLGGRVERVAEEDQAGQAVEPGGGHVRGHAAAERLAADDQPAPARIGPVAHRRDHGAEGGLEDRRPVRQATAFLHVREVERHGGEPAVGEGLRERRP